MADALGCGREREFEIQRKEWELFMRESRLEEEEAKKKQHESTVKIQPQAPIDTDELKRRLIEEVTAELMQKNAAQSEASVPDVERIRQQILEELKQAGNLGASEGGGEAFGDWEEVRKRREEEEDARRKLLDEEMERMRREAEEEREKLRVEREAWGRQQRDEKDAKEAEVKREREEFQKQIAFEVEERGRKEEERRRREEEKEKERKEEIVKLNQIIEDEREARLKVRTKD